jgi:hypothetical protein
MTRKKDDTLKAMADSAPRPAPDFAAADDAPAKDGEAPWLQSTADFPCPITPLGVHSSSKITFLDGLNQIVIAPTKCDKGDLMLWFGTRYLEAFYGADGKERWDQRKVQTALVEDCRNLGIFNPVGRVFGRGANAAPNAPRALVLHMGDRVLVSDPGQEKARDRLTVTRAGRVQVAGQVLYFPALPALPPPAIKAGVASEVQQLLATFKRFYFVEQEAAPLLLLGMTAQMFIAGALKWRAHMWLSAPTSSGKTTLQDIIREMLGAWCIHTEDSSEAAIRQILGQDTLAVLIDEAEAHDNPERLQRLLNLIKKASAGGTIIRGSADHKAQEFIAQSCFMLSSVLHAPLRGEDRNRIVILEMRKVPDNAERLPLETATYRHWGRAFHRRMIDHWERWEQTYSAYRAAIRAVGFGGREQDTYGTLLACADLLLYDHAFNDIVPTEEPGRERIAAHVATIIPMMQRSQGEARSDVDRAILHLNSSNLPGSNGNSPEPVGLWIDRAMRWAVEDKVEAGPDGWQQAREVPNEKARDKLKAHGLRVVNLQEPARPGGQPRVKDAQPEDYDGAYLAIAYGSNRALCDLFARSDWAGGAWVQSFAKVPGVQKAKVRFAGSPDNAICVPLSAMRAEDEG